MIRRDRPADVGFLFHIVSLIDRVLFTKVRKYLFFLKVGFRSRVMNLSRHSQQSMRLPLKTHTGLRSFFVRWNSHADFGVYYQVFINKDYDLSRFALGKRVEELYESMIRADSRDYHRVTPEQVLNLPNHHFLGSWIARGQRAASFIGRTYPFPASRSLAWQEHHLHWLADRGYGYHDWDWNRDRCCVATYVSRVDSPQGQRLRNWPRGPPRSWRLTI